MLHPSSAPSALPVVGNLPLPVEPGSGTGASPLQLPPSIGDSPELITNENLAASSTEMVTSPKESAVPPSIGDSPELITNENLAASSTEMVTSPKESAGLAAFILQEANDADLLSGNNSAGGDVQEEKVEIDQEESQSGLEQFSANATLAPTDLDAQEEKLKDWSNQEEKEWEGTNATNSSESTPSIAGPAFPTAPAGSEGNSDPVFSPTMSPTAGPKSSDPVLSPTMWPTAGPKFSDKDSWIHQVDMSEPTLAPVPQWNEAAPTFRLPTHNGPAFPPVVAPAVKGACKLVHYDACDPHVVLWVGGAVPLVLLCCLICICMRCCCRPSKTDDRGQYRVVANQYGAMKYDNTFSDDYSADGSTGDIELSLTEMNG